MPPPDEHETLVEQATRGDDAALEDLLVRHRPALERFVNRHRGMLVPGRDSVSDVVQSICRTVLTDLADFEYRGEKAFIGWLQRRVNQRRFEAA